MTRGFIPGLAAASALATIAVVIQAGAPAGFGDQPTAASLTPPQWREIAPGLEFARVLALRYCRSGSPGLGAVRLDPARCRVEPYHEKEYPRSAAATVDAWQRRLNAPVILNAGLYGEDRRHLGVLRRDGRDVGGSRHPSWKGMLAAGADLAGIPPAAVLDLTMPEEASRSERYPHAVQSMMLLDRQGGIRVRRTKRVAPRTVVAEDSAGKLYLLVTEGQFTLWETGALLREAGWHLTAALALDGGNEANLVVESPAVRYRTYLGKNDGGEGDFLRASVTLPCVLAVWPEGP